MEGTQLMHIHQHPSTWSSSWRGQTCQLGTLFEDLALKSVHPKLAQLLQEAEESEEYTCRS